MFRLFIFFLSVRTGFANKGELWKNDYETENFEKYLDNLWNQVKPLYDQLHKFVAYKLKERYGDKIDVADGLIPAHVFGIFIEFSCFFVQ